MPDNPGRSAPSDPRVIFERNLDHLVTAPELLEREALGPPPAVIGPPPAVIGPPPAVIAASPEPQDRASDVLLVEDPHAFGLCNEGRVVEETPDRHRPRSGRKDQSFPSTAGWRELEVPGDATEPRLAAERIALLGTVARLLRDGSVERLVAHVRQAECERV